MSKLTPKDWLDAGYRRCNQKFRDSDYLVQKLFSDNVGKRYYLTVYVYENCTKSYYEKFQGSLNAYSFMPDVQFLHENKLGLNIQLLLQDDTSILQVEEQVDHLWIVLGKPYYELSCTNALIEAFAEPVEFVEVID